MAGPSIDIDYITGLVMAELNKNPHAIKIPVNASNRHVHLTEEHYKILFGDLPFVNVKDLMQKGEFASNRTVDIEGFKQTIKGVRILGPFRSVTQVELAQTDARVVGVKAPVRMSGDTKNSAAITLIGPKGQLELREGCIIAQRHVHMNPEDAERFGVKNGDLVDVRIDGPRPTVYCNTVVRVKETFVLEMHLDTDETNALGNSNGQLYGIMV